MVSLTVHRKINRPLPVFIIVIIMTIVKHFNIMYHKNGDTNDCIYPVLGYPQEV